MKYLSILLPSEQTSSLSNQWEKMQKKSLLQKSDSLGTNSMFTVTVWLAVHFPTAFCVLWIAAVSAALNKAGSSNSLCWGPSGASLPPKETKGLLWWVLTCLCNEKATVTPWGKAVSRYQLSGSYGLSDFFALGRIVRGLESIGLYSVAVGAVYLSAGGTVLSKGLPTALFVHEQHALCVWPEQQGWCCSGRLGVTEVGTSFVIVVRLGLETGWYQHDRGSEQ